MTTLHRDELQLGACTKNPERRTTAPDDEAKALCRACPVVFAPGRPASCRAPKGCGRASSYPKRGAFALSHCDS